MGIPDIKNIDKRGAGKLTVDSMPVTFLSMGIRICGPINIKYESHRGSIIIVPQWR